MRTKTKIALVLCACTSLGACAQRYSIDARAIDGVARPVLDRHDAYVLTDQDITDLQREINLRDSALVRELLDTALEGAPE